jgi:hypothetical protein
MASMQRLPSSRSHVKQVRVSSLACQLTIVLPLGLGPCWLCCLPARRNCHCRVTFSQMLTFQPLSTGPLPKFKFNPTLLKPLEYDLPSLLGISFKFYEAQRSGTLDPKDNKVKWRGNSYVRDGAQVRGAGNAHDVPEHTAAATCHVTASHGHTSPHSSACVCRPPTPTRQASTSKAAGTTLGTT